MTAQDWLGDSHSVGLYTGNKPAKRFSNELWPLGFTSSSSQVPTIPVDIHEPTCRVGGVSHHHLTLIELNSTNICPNQVINPSSTLLCSTPTSPSLPQPGSNRTSDSTVRSSLTPRLKTKLLMDRVVGQLDILPREIFQWQLIPGKGIGPS